MDLRFNAGGRMVWDVAFPDGEADSPHKRGKFTDPHLSDTATTTVYPAIPGSRGADYA